MNTKRRCSAWIALVLALFIARTHLVEAGEGGGATVGSGGGGWVCRNQDAVESVRWVRLVDLFEAEAEFRLKVRKSNEPEHQQLEAALERIRAVAPEFHKLLSPFVDQVRARWPEIGESELSLVDDSLYRRIPDRKLCPDGTRAYEQMVNFNDDGIEINQELVGLLSLTEKAALKLHEAVYALLRSLDPSLANSRPARKIVAYVFSTRNAASYANLLVAKRGDVAKAVPSTAGGSEVSNTPVESLEMVECPTAFCKGDRVRLFDYRSGGQLVGEVLDVFGKEVEVRWAIRMDPRYDDTPYNKVVRLDASHSKQLQFFGPRKKVPVTSLREPSAVSSEPPLPSQIPKGGDYESWGEKGQFEYSRGRSYYRGERLYNDRGECIHKICPSPTARMKGATRPSVTDSLRRALDYSRSAQ